MASTIYFFLVALVCAARCNPLGQTMDPSMLPNILPGVGTTTICDSTPNVLGLGYGPLNLNLPSPLGLPLLTPPYTLPSTTVCDTKPNLPLYQPYSLQLPGMSSTTVCDTQPNILPYLPYNLQGSTTVCESAQNLPYHTPRSYLTGTTTVCENSPSLLPPIPGLGTTTICDSSPNLTPYLRPQYGHHGLHLPRLGNPIGTPYGYPLNGLSLNPLGLPLL